MSPSLAPSSSLLGALAAVGLAGAALLPQRALAADLDPGYADIPPVQQQVTFGSGWYVRGDIGATDDMYKVIASPSARISDVTVVDIRRTQTAAYDVSLGGGYAFTNSFRADIVVDFNQPSTYRNLGSPCRINSKLSTCNANTSLNRYDALINGYYDLGTWSIVTPYVGAGVGVGFGNFATHVFPSSGAAEQGYLGYRNFAWAAMAGVALDVYPHVKLDVGYRFIYGGHVFDRDLYNNEIRAGLRYMIDN